VSDSSGGYPARVELEPMDTIGRWRPMFQWVLAIPHYAVLFVIGIAAGVVTVLSWFAIVFTGKLPAGLANFQCMFLRYLTRTSAYTVGLRDEYPPFEFATTAQDPGKYVVRVGFEPSLDGRNRLSSGLRMFWVIPAWLVAYIIAIVGYACWFIGAWAVLFTGRWPKALQEWVEKTVHTYLRLYAYANLLTDEYPPLTFD